MHPKSGLDSAVAKLRPNLGYMDSFKPITTVLLYHTVFRSSIERWADGLKSPEMQMHGISAMKRAPERPPDVSEMIMNILECYISQTGLAHFHVTTV